MESDQQSCLRCGVDYFLCRLCGQATCCACNSTYVDEEGRLSSVSQLLAAGLPLEGHQAHFDCVRI